MKIFLVNFLQPTSMMASLMSIFMKKAFKPLEHVAGDCSRKHFRKLQTSFVKVIFSANAFSIHLINICIYFRLKGHRGESQILRGNRDFPSSDNWSWNPGDVKSVRKCDSCQKCSRHNVGFKTNRIPMGQI